VELESVLNLRMAVREWKDKVIFLHRVERGASDRSYGIHVARLAGVPRAVVERAREILVNLERDQFGRDGQPRRGRRKGGSAPPRAQKSLFSLLEEPRPDPAAAEVLERLMEQDLDQLTPMQALGLLQEWQKKLKE